MNLGHGYKGYNCFVQLPACVIFTKLPESKFRSRWRGIKQSDDQESWTLTWPSNTRKVIITDYIPEKDTNLEDDQIFIVCLHKWALVINGQSESLKVLKLYTNGNTHITNVCANVTKVDLQYSKLHLQAKWLNSLLLNVPNCTELNMESCGLSAEDIIHLCEETKGRDLNSEILNLENNDAITEGTDALVRFVRQCPRLREIILTSQEIPEEEKSTQDDIIESVMNIVLLVDAIKKVVELCEFYLYLDDVNIFSHEPLYAGLADILEKELKVSGSSIRLE